MGSLDLKSMNYFADADHGTGLTAGVAWRCCREWRGVIRRGAAARYKLTPECAACAALVGLLTTCEYLFKMGLWHRRVAVPQGAGREAKWNYPKRCFPTAAQYFPTSRHRAFRA